jgi:hypothetical protein
MRSYYSTVHLWAARYFAERVAQLESNPVKRGYSIEHRAYVIGSVVEAWSFLEAAVNELFKDCVDGHGSYISVLPAQSVANLADAWNGWHSGGRTIVGTLEKYQAALRACSKSELDKGRVPYQDADLLTRLRNALVHFTPESRTADDPHHLGDALRSKFVPNALMQGMGNPYFPDHCLGAGCASWAVLVAQTFGDQFFSAIGIKPNHQLSGFIEGYQSESA